MDFKTPRMAAAIFAGDKSGEWGCPAASQTCDLAVAEAKTSGTCDGAVSEVRRGGLGFPRNRRSRDEPAPSASKRSSRQLAGYCPFYAQPPGPAPASRRDFA